MTASNSNHSGFRAMFVASFIFLLPIVVGAFRNNNADQPPVPKWADVNNNKSPSSPLLPLPPLTNAESSTSTHQQHQHQQQLDEFASFAHQLANAARTEISPYWRPARGRHVLGQEIKSESGRSEFQSASPVTLADRAAERVMRELISSAYPDHGIYGEEYGIKDADADWVWVLDPIDGTRSFITGKPLFGTLISLLYKGTPVIGVIDQFVLNERWLGIAGKQSTLNGVPIRTDGATALSAAEMYSTTPDMFQKGDALSKFNAMRRAVRTAHYGADCYAYALVASGFGADIVLEADLGLYDYCSLVPILQGAGGVISDWTGNSLTLANHDMSKGRVLASANPLLHRQALDILNAQTSSLAAAGAAGSNDELLAVLNENSSTNQQQHGSITPWICGVMLGEAIAHYAP